MPPNNIICITLEGDQKGRLGLRGRIILKWDLDKKDGINLSQDRDQWRILVNTAVNLRVS